MRFAIAFVCQRGGLEAKSVLLAASLRRSTDAGVELIACLPGPASVWGEPSPETLELLASLGVRTLPVVNPIDDSYAIGNKISCLDVPTDAERLVFLDSDILCLRHLSPARWFATGFAAKPADGRSFPAPGAEDDWKTVYRLFGLTEPDARMSATVSGEVMRPYYNAGVIAVPANSGFGRLWADCCRTIDAGADVRRKRPHLDQIGLPVAAALSGLEVSLLGEEVNFPGNLRPLGADLPVLYHYHRPDVLCVEPLVLNHVADLVRAQPGLRAILELEPTWHGVLGHALPGPAGGPSPAGTRAADASPPAAASANHDIGEAHLQWAIDRSPTPETLRRLVGLSRNHFGWFSKQVSRAFEYPWVATALQRLGRKPVLDIGAGISPLPLLLAETGTNVVTMDNSPLTRDPDEGGRQWNGWGFLDYSALHPGIRSIHADAATTSQPPGMFPAIYSVSVLEHLPATARRAVWGRIAHWLEPGGSLFITVDLVPGTNRLWNRNGGQIVEPDAEHGDVDGVIEELRQLGFALTERVELRDLPGMEAECAMLGFVAPDRRLHNPAFLVGCMRSGTTLLAGLLGRCDGVVHCPFELKQIWSQVGGVSMASPKTRDTTCAELDADDVRPGQADALTEAFVAEMDRNRGSRAGGGVFLNKNPHLANKLPFVQALFPEARFLFIVRRLPTVVASIKKLFADVAQRQQTWHHWPLPDPDVRARCWEAFHHEPPPASADASRCFPGGDVRHIAEYWLETNAAISRFAAAGGRGRSLVLHQEHLIARPEDEVARCLEFLGVPRPDLSWLERQVDPGRNEIWDSRLTADELTALVDFVDRHRAAIDAVHPDAAASSLTMLHGALARK